MNKNLLRQLRPIFHHFTPHNTRKLIRAFEVVGIAAGKNLGRLHEGLIAFIKHTGSTLRKQGASEREVSYELSKIAIAGCAWIEKLIFLWSSFCSPAILLLLCLETTLDNNLVPERRNFTFEEIKHSLADRHWPPQRQRCDFIPVPAI
jgi:hypothetical protein